MKFLTVDRSWSERRATFSPYRLRYGLPKFNSGKSQNVFQNEKSKTQPIEAGEVLPRATVTLEKPIADARQREWLKQSGSKLFLTVMASCGSIVQKLPKLDFFAKRRTRSIFQKAKPTTLQAELSLDKVKVLRNDLSDADLEVVPIGSARAGQKKLKLNLDDAASQGINFKQQVSELFELQETQAH